MGNQSSKAKLRGFEGKYDLGGKDRAVISSILTAILGNLGDALSRGIFYQGAYGFDGDNEIGIRYHNAWTMLLPMPFSNIIGMIIHSMNGVKGKINKLGGREKHEGRKDEDGNKTVKQSGKDFIIGTKNDGKHVLIDYDKHRPVYDSWVLLLIFIPIFGHYSAWMSGAANPYKSFMVISILCMLSMIMARLYSKARVCNPNLEENEVKKFTLGNATREAVDALLIANACYAAFTIQLFFLGGYDDFNFTGIQGWLNVLVGESRIYWKLIVGVFGLALLPYALVETFLPGMTYGLILACTHMYLNAKLRYNNKYKKEICDKNDDIQIFHYRPPFFSKKAENWQFFGKLIGLIIIYAFAISAIPCFSGYFNQNNGARGFCPGYVMDKLNYKSTRKSFSDYYKDVRDDNEERGYGRFFGNAFGDTTQREKMYDDFGTVTGNTGIGDSAYDRATGVGNFMSRRATGARNVFGNIRNKFRGSKEELPVYRNEFSAPSFKKYNGNEIPVYSNEFSAPSFKKYNGNEIPVYLREYRK